MKGIKGKVIAVTSGKGGVGKTVLATNLAGVYHFLKKKILLIDMDLSSGGVSILLNLQNSKTIYNLADDILNNRFKNPDDYVSHYSEYIDVLSACKDPRQGNKIEIKLIEQVISLYKNNYDVIILDTCHIPTFYTLESLDMADEVLFVVTDNPLDLKNSSSLLTILDEFKENSVHVILNNSINLESNYFSKFDIKNIIKHNINYILPSSMYINNINKYFMDGEILVLNKNLSFKNKKDSELLIKIANDLVGDIDEK